MLPTVSVIIPAFNAQDFIADAILSVQQQTYGAVECIVVDDGSTDGTSDVVRHFPDVKYLRQLNKGVAAARNHGATKASGDLLAFLDADDAWMPHKVERQAALLASQPHVALVHCGIEVTDESLNPLAVRPCAPGRTQAVERALRLYPPAIYATTVMLRRRAFEISGGYDERLSTSADTDLACRIAIDFPIVGMPEPLVRYRTHCSQMHRNLVQLEADHTRMYAKMFSCARPDWMQLSRRRAEAALQLTLAIAYVRSGHLGRGLRHLNRGFGAHPAEMVERISALTLLRLRGAVTLSPELRARERDRCGL